jgi:hypothetical protein
MATDETMTAFTIKNKETDTVIEREFKDLTEATHWVTRHLNLDLGWTVLPSEES